MKEARFSYSLLLIFLLGTCSVVAQKKLSVAYSIDDSSRILLPDNEWKHLEIRVAKRISVPFKLKKVSENLVRQVRLNGRESVQNFFSKTTSDHLLLVMSSPDDPVSELELQIWNRRLQQRIVAIEFPGMKGDVLGDSVASAIMKLIALNVPEIFKRGCYE